MTSCSSHLWPLPPVVPRAGTWVCQVHSHLGIPSWVGHGPRWGPELTPSPLKWVSAVSVSLCLSESFYFCFSLCPTRGPILTLPLLRGQVLGRGGFQPQDLVSLPCPVGKQPRSPLDSVLKDRNLKTHTNQSFW